MAESGETGGGGSGAYTVLARKYRPAHFRDLIGQEAMVMTLTNAFAAGRIAHAFMLTGVRGVGKTTTARIIAKGLNCTGRGDRPTIDPCGECPPCLAIAAGRHTDVLEMDAASNTGVDYIREINEAVRYRPAEVRYKVYIIDEVHMLTTSSFNALLKTLEEPPPHVKFIMATTEIRKVPVTVLSRCQRFDLRRIEPEAMTAHLAEIAAKEGAEVDAGALALITRAAEGSVRDGLSLLDQAIAMGSADSASVRVMLGLADRGRVIDLFERIMKGDVAGALAELSAQYSEGADPAAVLRDLAELTHWISVLAVSPDLAEDPSVRPDERARGLALAEGLAMRTLTRTWQMLLKALEELPHAPNAMMAAEMAMIRLTHVADLPPPEEILRRLDDTSSSREPPQGPSPAPSGNGPASGGTSGPSASVQVAEMPSSGPAARLEVVSGGAVRLGTPAPDAPPREAGMAEPALAPYARFEDVLEMLATRRELRLLDAVERYVSLVAYRPGHIEFHPADGAPGDLAGRLGQLLKQLTGARWSVAVTEAPGAPTVSAEREAARLRALEEAAAHPLVAAALEIFPGAAIRDVRPLVPEPVPEPVAAGPTEEYLEPVPDWDDEPAEDGLDALVDGDNPFEEN